MTYLIALPFICALLDWYRGYGDKGLPKYVIQLAYGGAVGYALTTDWRFLLAYAALFALGSAPGYGSPMGQVLTGKDVPDSPPERWQIGPLKRNPNLALVARGLIWAAPALVLAYWQPLVWYTLLMGLALPMGALLAAHLPRLRVDKFALSNGLRGFTFGLLLTASQFPSPL